MSAWTAEERETIIGWDDSSDTAEIWTASPKKIKRLRSDARFTETESVTYPEGETATFTIPLDRWSAVRGAKRILSEEERARRAAGLLRNTGKEEGNTLDPIVGSATPADLVALGDPLSL